MAHPRMADAFPILGAHDIERTAAFGSLRNYEKDSRLFHSGQTGDGLFLILSGHVTLCQRDGLGASEPMYEAGPGQFLGEIGQLSGNRALVDAIAQGEVRTRLLTPGCLRELVVIDASLGERIMRALILRRVMLIERGIGGPLLIGPGGSSNMTRIRGFLTRNTLPHRVLDPASDARAKAMLDAHSPSQEELPLVVCPDGTILCNPAENTLATHLGMLDLPDEDKVYDVAIVGAGPAGLATAVYAGSEGLSVIVLDGRSFGGQAGASARIENYFGFPTGITGQALTARAFVQAQKFGVKMRIPTQIKHLDCSRKDGDLLIKGEAGSQIRARTVVVATGARYRRPDIAQLSTFEGRGVWYWASPIEAKICADQDVVLVGGGNSAGQAAVYLAAHVAKVRIMIRRESLVATMSRYLIDRIAATPNIELIANGDIVALEGDADGHLIAAHWRERGSGTEHRLPTANVFLFVGADPETDWLADCGVVLDKSGFVVTGVASETNPAPAMLESSVPGVFAVGDVRCGSVKRIGGAIGEGAQVVPALHAFVAVAASV
ncbi:cyclic nucleotide-binding domain-containing protein [Pigmentiphaga aceris]|uniref:Cyclic nucleotide-binding domain-containing protein n=1 Tax=Pigmentiphaga aceris TaxID=1940612 RepID=A0A5C0B0Y3_9BURK|nr:FAD-dependent oxidoreductase [Pigmentiphaga aceris]QEI06297.1 cyclic nucleotide-binding domain-containing protein [Pigmentiphaga aceris]